MIFNLLKLLAISTVWILKCFTSLPKLQKNLVAKFTCAKKQILLNSSNMLSLEGIQENFSKVTLL